MENNVEKNFKEFWNQENLDKEFEKIQREVGKVLEMNFNNPTFFKNLKETQEVNPNFIQNLSKEECSCGSNNLYSDCCMYDEDYDKSKFPPLLQEKFMKEFIGFKPRVYSKHELKRSGIKHINRYELSVLDVMGIISDKILFQPSKHTPFLYKCYLVLWKWLVEQNNPYLLLQVKMIQPRLF